MANHTAELIEAVREYRGQVAYTLEKRQEFMLLGPDDHPHIAERDAQIVKAQTILKRLDTLLAKTGAA